MAGKYLPKLEASVAARAEAHRRALLNVAAARRDGRWEAASPAERARARHSVGMLRERLRLAVAELERYQARTPTR
jgi:hypothetical protein